MSVTVAEWKNGKNGKKFRVNIGFRWSDGTPCRVKRYQSFPNEKAAKRWGEQLEAHLREQGKPAPPPPESGIPTFGVFCKETWQPHLRTLLKLGKRKPSAIDAIDDILRLHLVPHIGDVRLDLIDNAWCDRLIDIWTGKPKTLRNRMAVLRSSLAYAVKKAKLLPIMPCTIELETIESDEAAHYDQATYERLLEGALEVDLRVYVAVLLGGDAGLRRGEIVALSCEDVQGERITVAHTIYAGRKGSPLVETRPKGKRIKTISITKRLAAALKKLCGTRKGRVLWADDGGHVTPRMLHRWVEKAERAAGLEVTGRLHVLRHSHITHLVDAGASLTEVAEQARHADLKVTDRYIHNRREAASRGIAKLEKARAK